MGDYPVAAQIVTENPKGLIFAACQLVRSVSRSVSTPRKSLTDSELASTIFVLLKYQDVEIEVTAPPVICNLALDLSPMRKAILGGGGLKILCEHAHSMNTSLLFNLI